MPATYAEDAALVRHDCPAELRYAKLVVQGYFMRTILLNIEEVD